MSIRLCYNLCKMEKTPNIPAPVLSAETMPQAPQSPNRYQTIGAKAAAQPEELEKKRFTINEETKISDIESNIAKYLEWSLKSEKPLESNLLMYSLKKLYEEDIEKFDNIMATPAIAESLKDAKLQDTLNERIEKLEYFDTPDYTFLVPIDQWNENAKILPANRDGIRAIMPKLTAILKQPVNLRDKNMVIYDEKWVGKEIEHFPPCRDLAELEKKIQDTIDDHLCIPRDWYGIVNSVRNDLAQKGLCSPNDFNSIGDALVKTFDFTYSGRIRDSEKIWVNKPGDTGYYLALGKNNNSCLEVSDIGEPWDKRYNPGVRAWDHDACCIRFVTIPLRYQPIPTPTPTPTPPPMISPYQLPGMSAPLSPIPVRAPLPPRVKNSLNQSLSDLLRSQESSNHEKS